HQGGRAFAADVSGRRRHGRPALYLVALRLLAQGTDRRGPGTLEERAFPAGARRDRVHSSARDIEKERSMAGIHHVTAIAGSADRNLDFYSRTLGLRFVKKTVNFDDPGTYHLYYGDETGRPGTILTFFPWTHVAPGRLGVGRTEETAFRVPEGPIGYWTHRCVEKGVPHQAPRKRFGETVLPFKDPDGTA